jgi:hypothetical protein
MIRFHRVFVQKSCDRKRMPKYFLINPGMGGIDAGIYPSHGYIDNPERIL